MSESLFKITVHGDDGAPSRSLRVRLLKYRWTAIAVAYFVALLVADSLATPHQSFTGLFVLIPILLSMEWGPRFVVVGSLPLVVLAASSTLGLDQVTTESTVIRTVGLSLGIGVAAYAAAYREHHAVVLGHSRAATEAAHKAILPVVPPRLGHYRFASAYRSAAQEAFVGGDLYKVVETDFGVRLIVGDVQGKGLKAIGLTSVVLGCFREWAPETGLLKDLVARLDARVVDKGDGSFVTAIVSTLGDDGEAEIANCGHPSPIHFRHGRPLAGIIPAHRTTPLGLAPDPALTTVALAPGDRAFFYTDGLVECRDQRGAWIELDVDLIGTLGSDPLEDASARASRSGAGPGSHPSRRHGHGPRRVRARRRYPKHWPRQPGPPLTAVSPDEGFPGAPAGPP